MSKLGTFSSLRYRDFRYLWGGTMLMSAGQWIQQVTLGWLLYDLTGSAILLGALNGLRTLPFLVSGPIAGVVIDRMDRRKLLIQIHYVLVVTAFAMGALAAASLVRVWHLFVFTLITGVAWSFNQPLRVTLVSNTVPQRELTNALALESGGFNITKVLAPVVGGALIAWFGVAGNFFVQGAAYAGVAFMIYLIRVTTPARTSESSISQHFKEGLAYTWSNPLVMALMVTAFVPGIFAMPYLALTPIFQKDVLKVGPEGLGLMMAAPGVGAILSMLLLASIANRVMRQGLLLLSALIVWGCFLILFSRTTTLPLALLALSGIGGCQIFFGVTSNALIQSIVPNELRGRVLSLYLIDRGLSPAGSMLAGVMAHMIGAPATVAILGSFVIVLAGLVAWRVPRIRTLRA